MTATDDLRRMLDERGIKWWPMHDVEAGYYQDRDTEFVIDGKKYTAHEWGGKLTVYGLIPAQAIAATLGTGTCHLEINTSMTAVVCDRCNYPMPRGTVLTEVHFCPNCGRKVVDE